MINMFISLYLFAATFLTPSRISAVLILTYTYRYDKSLGEVMVAIWFFLWLIEKYQMMGVGKWGAAIDRETLLDTVRFWILTVACGVASIAMLVYSNRWGFEFQNLAVLIPVSYFYYLRIIWNSTTHDDPDLSWLAR